MSLSWQDFATGQARRMTREALDRELSPSRLVASLDDELVRYARLSSAARAAAREAGCLTEGVPYRDPGGSPGAHDPKLDLFSPGARGATPVPALIYIHGGFWQMLGRRDSAFAAPGILAAGGALVAVGYTLAPAATLAEIVEQVRDAVAWLYRHAVELGLDRSRLVIAGSSAGAHLAAMVLATDWTARGLPRDVLHGACLVSGVYDLAAVRESYVDEPLKLTAEDVARLSPLRLPVTCDATTVVAYGDNESAEFKRESRLFAGHLRAHGHDVVTQEVAGRHHFDVILDLDRPDTLLGHSTRSLLGLAGSAP